MIQSELGEDDGPQELDEYRDKIRALGLAEDVEEKLSRRSPAWAARASAAPRRASYAGYLDTCLELPWNKYTKETLDIKKARKCSTRTTTASRRSRSAS